MTRATIAIDAMGGDFGPSVTVPATLEILKKYPHLKIILVGNEDAINSVLAHHQAHPDRLTIHHTTQQVEMDEPPRDALRKKKDSSMRVAINLVKEEQAQACVSAGNTGALMATARFVLKTITGIDRPAIISSFPTASGKKMRMVDLGANVDSSAEDLCHFALMGTILVAEVDNITHPKVFLLNIGEEDIKGNEQVKQTAQLLASFPSINYAGYIEGDSIYKGEADIVLCDGFVGNVALKTTEGVALLITSLIKQAFKKNIFTKLVGLLAMPIFRAVAKRVDPAQHNGATFIGLRGVVIKSHGSANVKAFSHAIEEAIVDVEKNIPTRIQQAVEKRLQATLTNEC